MSPSCSCLSAIYTVQEIQSMLHFSLPCRRVKMPPISAFMMYVILQTNLDTFPDVLKKPPINASVIRIILLTNPENSARSFLIAHMAVRYSFSHYLLLMLLYREEIKMPQSTLNQQKTLRTKAILY